MMVNMYGGGIDDEDEESGQDEDEDDDAIACMVIEEDEVDDDPEGCTQDVGLDAMCGADEGGAVEGGADECGAVEGGAVEGGACTDAAESGTPNAVVDPASLKVEDLRIMLKERGADTKGTKNVLQERLAALLIISP